LGLGNSGTEQDFINSLTGPEGPTGPSGDSLTNSPSSSQISDYVICNNEDCVNNLLSENWKLFGGVSIDESRGGTGGNTFSRNWKQALVFSTDFTTNQIEDYKVIFDQNEANNLISQGYQPYGTLSYGESRGGTGGGNFSSSIGQSMVKLSSNNSANLGFGNTLYFSNSENSNGTSVLNNLNGNYSNFHGTFVINEAETNSWTVPEGIYEIKIIHFGTDGGDSGMWCASTPPNGCAWGDSEGKGGYGRDVSFIFDVNPGDIFQITNGENGVNNPDGYKDSPPTVGGNGGLSEIYINDQLLFHSVGGLGGIRGQAPCGQCAPGAGSQGANGQVYFYGDSQSGYAASTLASSYNYGLNPLGLKQLYQDLRLVELNLNGFQLTAKTVIIY
jgi:hypothetical protein